MEKLNTIEMVGLVTANLGQQENAYIGDDASRISFIGDCCMTSACRYSEEEFEETFAISNAVVTFGMAANPEYVIVRGRDNKDIRFDSVTEAVKYITSRL